MLDGMLDRSRLSLKGRRGGPAHRTWKSEYQKWSRECWAQCRRPNDQDLWHCGNTELGGYREQLLRRRLGAPWCTRPSFGEAAAPEAASAERRRRLWIGSCYRWAWRGVLYCSRLTPHATKQKYWMLGHIRRVPSLSGHGTTTSSGFSPDLELRSRGSMKLCTGWLLLVLEVSDGGSGRASSGTTVNVSPWRPRDFAWWA